MTIESDTLQFEGITLQPRQFAEAQFRTPFSNSERQAASLPTFVGALIVRAGLLYPSLPECPVARIRSGTITAIGPIMNGQIIIDRDRNPRWCTLGTKMFDQFLGVECLTIEEKAVSSRPDEKMKKHPPMVIQQRSPDRQIIGNTV